MKAMSQTDELTELLSQLAGNLREEDMEDPELVTLLSQLVIILENEENPLPGDLIEQLAQIKDPKERFIEAAQALGVGDVNSLHQLAEQMKASGLLKG